MPPRHSVYVTRKIPGPWLGRLESKYQTLINPSRSPPSRNSLLKAVKGKSAILCMLSDKINRQVMDAAGAGLKIISTYSTGYEHIEVEEATRRGIFVTFTSDVLAEATADLTFALILSAARNVVKGDRIVRSGDWKVGWMPDLLLGSAVAGSNLGIIGMGRIGTAVARRASGFSMKILYCGRTRKPEAEALTGASYVSLENLLSSSDYVSIHANASLPAEPANVQGMSTDAKARQRRPLIDADRLRLMKKTAYLINTARGQLVDEAALAKALRSGMLAGAGLDVYNKEPLSLSSPLCKLANVTLLPHIGSATFQTRERMAEVAVTNVERVLEGNLPEPAFTVNQGLLKRA